MKPVQPGYVHKIQITLLLFGDLNLHLAFTTCTDKYLPLVANFLTDLSPFRRRRPVMNGKFAGMSGTKALFGLKAALFVWKNLFVGRVFGRRRRAFSSWGHSRR